MIDPKKLPRLEGDALFQWAMMMAREQQIAEAKQTLAHNLLRERGLEPGDHLLGPDGHIFTKEQVEELDRLSRVQSLPFTTRPRPDLESPDRSLDNGSSEKVVHTAH